jgi:hypothetical protein
MGVALVTHRFRASSSALLAIISLVFGMRVMVMASDMHEAQVVKPCNTDAVMRSLGYSGVGHCLVTEKVGGLGVA